LIGRIRERSAFDRLARDGTRIHRSTLWCTWCPDPDSTTTFVAFAIGRAYGSAVARNRVRRRLRNLLAELDRRTALPPGLLLIGVRPQTIELTFDQLRVQLESMMAALPITAVACKP
jgi:ribonuclease P protein component